MAVKGPQTAPGPHLLPLPLAITLPMPRNSAKQRIGAREADNWLRLLNAASLLTLECFICSFTPEFNDNSIVQAASES